MKAWLSIPTLAFHFLVHSSVFVEAGELSLESWHGHEVLKLSGIIDEGTADKFAAIMPSVRPLPHGFPVLLLDSPGGSVSEALKISEMMDTHPFHTVIPDGARCASACGSIIFIAGIYRTLEVFGALGQHSCSVDGVANQQCNDMLSEHAVRHGVSYGSIAAYTTYVAPEDIIWFLREDADGWGLTRYFAEIESGFEKSEPRVIEMLNGTKPLAQSAWRVDFREDGFKAFLRPASDDVREMQVNLFCNESLPGRLFLSMEINGPSPVVSDAILSARIETDLFSWEVPNPIIWQEDLTVTEIIAEVPQERISQFLSKANNLNFSLAMKKPYQPIIASTFLQGSRDVLLFSANHCPSGNGGDPKPPLN